MAGASVGAIGFARALAQLRHGLSTTEILMHDIAAIIAFILNLPKKVEVANIFVNRK